MRVSVSRPMPSLRSSGHDCAAPAIRNREKTWTPKPPARAAVLRLRNESLRVLESGAAGQSDFRSGRDVFCCAAHPNQCEPPRGTARLPSAVLALAGYATVLETPQPRVAQPAPDRPPPA